MADLIIFFSWYEICLINNMATSKIIIQDRDKDTANALRSLLSQAGYSVITIKTLKTLKSLIVKFQPQLLVIECDKNDDEAKVILADLRNNFNLKIVTTSCDNN